MKYLFILTLSLLSGAACAEPAAVTPASPELVWEEVGAVLTVFLVLSLVFETALTPLFNWRIFLANFEGKGAKTPITVMSAFFVFWGYDLDIVADLLTALGYAQQPRLGGHILTALLIAGGSDGIFRIFTKLGIRNPAERRAKAEEAKAQQGGGGAVVPATDAKG